jgi:hypothetical protein
VGLGTDAMSATLERHQQLGEATRTLFAILTGAYVVLLALPLLWQKLSGAYFHVVTHLVFLLALLAAGILLVNTAHLGGRLVHEFGIHADLGAAPAQPKKPTEPKKPAEPETGAPTKSASEPETVAPTKPESEPKKPAEPEAGAPKKPESVIAFTGTRR